MRSTTAATVWAAVLIGGHAAAFGEPTSVDLRFEGGSEYDTNIHRLEEADGEDLPIERAPLLRLAARGRVGWRDSRDRLRLDARVGGKLHGVQGGGGEDVAVVAGDVGWEHRLGQRAVSSIVRASYYDAIGIDRGEPLDRYETRNFRTASGEGGIALEGPRDHRVSGAFGYQAFHLKARSRYDWTAPTARIGWQTTLWRGERDEADPASLDLSLSYRGARRAYDTTARSSSCPDGTPPRVDCSMDTTIPRVDLFHAFAVEAVWTGARIYSARYELDYDDSNSQGDSFVRQRLELGATTELGRDVYLTGEVAVLYNVFLDSLLVARDVNAVELVSIEDENRSSVTALLAWRASTQTTVEARFALYTSALAGAELDYNRQTFYLGVVRDL